MRMKVGALMALGLALIAAATLGHKRPILVWNTSASVPIGLYITLSRPAHIGDYVLIRLSGAMQALAERRRYIAKTPLLKRVAAMEGDRVCRRGRMVRIAGWRSVIVLGFDREGRQLPVWQGCHRLQSGQVFVVGTHSESFDSRYFGPLHVKHVIGTAIPVWQIR